MQVAHLEFGFSSRIVLILTNIIIIGIIIAIIISEKDKLNNWMIASLSLILAGGMGNLVDRIFRGYVIDYLDINALFSYPVFNLADICVVTGVIFLVITMIKSFNK